MASDAWKWKKMDKFGRLSVSAGHRRCCLLSSSYFCRGRQRVLKQQNVSELYLSGLQWITIWDPKDAKSSILWNISRDQLNQAEVSL